MYIADVLELRSVDPNHKTDETLPPIYSFKVLLNGALKGHAHSKNENLYVLDPALTKLMPPILASCEAAPFRSNKDFLSLVL